MEGQYDEEYTPKQGSKQSNLLPLWGNERSMNLNPLILTNIQSSHYFKVNLYELKTYHEVVDEIYYKVTHLEPWEKGSRRTSGQTGMCGGVRGVGAGGIVSTAYCLLYKLFTLKLTRKQLNGLVTHCDSPYIRALGFMYIRYTQPPQNLLEWYEPYMDDTEELDVKAGGGQTMKIGIMLRQWLVKLEWFSTLFPRIPVPIQQKINSQMQERFPAPVHNVTATSQQNQETSYERNPRAAGEWERPPERDRDREVKRERDYGRERERDRDRSWDQRDFRDRPIRERTRERSPHRERHHRSSRERDHYREHHATKESHRSKHDKEKYRR